MSKDKIFENVLQELSKQKDELLRAKIKELKLDLKDEHRKRFKSFVTVEKDNKQTVYYDNGSMDGLRVITFIIKVNGDKIDLKHY